MKRTLALLATSLVIATAATAAEVGFKPLFNGKDLAGWEGLPQFWSVKDGAITGQTTAENPTRGNTFLVWRGGTVGDFELRLSYKIVGNNERKQANSGIQYRSKVTDEKAFVVGGYQADFEAGKTYSGILYEERGRGILAQRGQKTVIKEVDGKHKVEAAGTVGKSDEIQAKIKDEDWNDYVVIAKGNHLQHFINGVQTVDVVDEQPSKAAKYGILALQLHAGPPMTVQFRNIRLKELAKTAGLDGTWRVVSGTIDGQPAPQDFVDNVTVTVEGKAYRITHGSEVETGTFTVDDTKSPKAMDVRPGNSADRVIPAIYELDGDTLRICYATKGERPTGFKSEADSGVVFLTYKRK